jgi:hypothetical protein
MPSHRSYGKFAPEIATSDFALWKGHRRIAISVVASTLNSAAPSRSRWPVRRLDLAQPDGFRGRMKELPKVVKVADAVPPRKKTGPYEPHLEFRIDLAGNFG